MKTLVVNGASYQAERIVKTTNAVIGYNGNTEVFAFRGITNWSAFQLAEGQDWDVDRVTELQQRLAQSEQEQAALLLELVSRGVI